MFSSDGDGDKQKRLKVNKQFINEVKEKESRKKTPKHLIETCLEAAKKQAAKKSTE